MPSRAVLVGSLVGFIYSLLGYDSFLLWNYYETTLRGPITSGPNVIDLFVGLANLPIAFLFQPGSLLLEFLKNIGLPVFSTLVPFPYTEPISLTEVLLGIAALTIAGGIIGLLIGFVIKLFAPHNQNISTNHQNFPIAIAWKNGLLILTIGAILLIPVSFLVYLNNQSYKEKQTPLTNNQDGSLDKQTTTEVDTVGWEIHRSKTFEIKYPSGWSISKYAMEFENVVIKDPKSSRQVTITIFTTGGGDSDTQNVEIWDKVDINFGSRKIVANELTYKNGSWLLFPRGGEDGGRGEVFSLYATTVPSQAEREELLNILSTFKFLE